MRSPFGSDVPPPDPRAPPDQQNSIERRRGERRRVLVLVDVERRSGEDRRENPERRSGERHEEPIAEHIRNALQLIVHVADSDQLDEEHRRDLDAALFRLRFALDRLERGGGGGAR